MTGGVLAGGRRVAGAGGYSRVTLVGARRRVDVLLPSDEQLGRMVPDLLALLGDEAEAPARVRQLVTVTGEVITDDLTLAAAGVADGAVLRLVAQHEAPPVPVVHDVAEETAADHDDRAWRWGPGPRRWVAGAAVAALLVAAGVLVDGVWRTGYDAEVLAVLLLVAGGVLAATGREALGAAVTAGGGGVWVLAAWRLADAGAWSPAWRWAAVGSAVVGMALALGLASPLGRSAILGGWVGLALLGVWVAGIAFGGRTERLAAVTGVAAVLLLGVLPRLALSVSGLAGLDDRRFAGEPVGRRDVAGALAAAHRGLAVATVVAAAWAALAGWLLARAGGGWTVALALLLGVVLLLRARAFPLAVEVTALVAGAGVVAVGLLRSWNGAGGGPSPWALLLVVVLLAGPVVALGAEPAEHVRTWLRRAGDWAETAAVVATVPVLLGVFGVYERLLSTF